MWCPKCKNEYVQGITQCADCGVALVNSLEEYEAAEAKASMEAFREMYENSEESAVSDGTAKETDDAPVQAAHAYVSKKSKTEDLKSTAYTFTIVGTLGLVLLVLFAVDVIPLHTASYMKVMICLVMGAMFLIFLAIGIRSFAQIKSYSDAADNEEHLLAEITTWFRDSYDKAAIDTGLDLSQQEEMLYFSRYEVMRKYITEKYPKVEESLLDHIIETLYAEIF